MCRWTYLKDNEPRTQFSQSFYIEENLVDLFEHGLVVYLYWIFALIFLLWVEYKLIQMSMSYIWLSLTLNKLSQKSC